MKRIQKQAKNGGAVLSFELASEEHVHQLFENCQLPIVAVSLGGVESILSLPWCMSHASMPEEERLKMGITPTLVRLSCGIEDIEDLIADFEQASVLTKNAMHSLNLNAWHFFIIRRTPIA